MKVETLLGLAAGLAAGFVAGVACAPDKKSGKTVEDVKAAAAKACDKAADLIEALMKKAGAEEEGEEKE